VRQRGRTDHQAEDQRQEVLLGDGAVLLDLLGCLAGSRERLGMGLDRGGTGTDTLVLGPGSLGSRRISREVLDGLFRSLDRLGVRRFGSLQRGDVGFQLGLFLGKESGTTGFQALQLGVGGGSLFAEDGADRFLGGTLRRGLVVELLLQRRHLEIGRAHV
jgi:hypothetical protein